MYWPASSGSYEKYPHLEQDEASHLSYVCCNTKSGSGVTSISLEEERSHYPHALLLRVWSVPTTKLRVSCNDRSGIMWTIGDFEASLLMSDGPKTPEPFLGELGVGAIEVIWLATTSYHVNPERAKCLVVEQRDWKARRLGTMIIHCAGRPLQNLDELGIAGDGCFEQHLVSLC